MVFGFQRDKPGEKAEIRIWKVKKEANGGPVLNPNIGIKRKIK